MSSGYLQVDLIRLCFADDSLLSKNLVRFPPSVFLLVCISRFFPSRFFPSLLSFSLLVFSVVFSFCLFLCSVVFRSVRLSFPFPNSFPDEEFSPNVESPFVSSKTTGLFGVSCCLGTFFMSILQGEFFALMSAQRIVRRYK